MGRGRQKAKQTKVARELKYASFEPNYEALQRELGSTRRSDVATESRHESDYANYDENDPYSGRSDEF
ncbi:DUF3073 domain-containing protein [Timonella senegalensis]|uniref:DUF3073 domain-containing protein n=1 Tax=Timonella senegalensis TaxID=1465825 RepID=UPI0028AD2BD4|nr:DUF3073 domain-containing protein [Timonella senegalensis]